MADQFGRRSFAAIIALQGVPVAVGAAFGPVTAAWLYDRSGSYLVVYLADHPRGRRGLGMFLQLLNGVPSILFGIFGLIVFVGYFNLGKSWLTGGVLLGVMILPTVTVALIERREALLRRYVEAATGLGADPHADHPRRRAAAERRRAGDGGDARAGAGACCDAMLNSPRCQEVVDYLSGG